MIGLPDIQKARQRGRRVGGLFAFAAILGGAIVAAIKPPLIVSAALILGIAFAAHRAWLCLYLGERLLNEVERGVMERQGDSP